MKWISNDTTQSSWGRSILMGQNTHLPARASVEEAATRSEFQGVGRMHPGDGMVASLILPSIPPAHSLRLPSGGRFLSRSL